LGGRADTGARVGIDPHAAIRTLARDKTPAEGLRKTPSPPNMFSTPQGQGRQNENASAQRELPEADPQENSP
jgi:hypothetical protein